MNKILKPDRHIPYSLRLKVSLGVALPLLVILLIFTWLEYNHLRNVLLNQLSLVAAQAGQVVEDNLRQQMLINDFEALQQTLNAISDSQGFRSISLLNTKGEVIFAPGNRDVGKILNKNHPGCQSCHTLPPVERFKSIVTTTEDGATVFRSMKPIENSPACAKCHEPSQRLIGLLLIDISTEPLEASLNEALTTSLVWWSGTVAIMLLVINLVLHFFVLNRLEGFASAFKVLSSGRPAPKLPDTQRDEIGRLANTFNSMADQIEQRQAENTTLSLNLQKENAERSNLLRRLIRAQEDERKRIARELHDELGQSLSGLSLHADALNRMITSNPSRALDQCEQIRQIVIQTADQLHNLIMDLRPSVLDDLGLVAALHAYAERLFKDSPIQVSYDIEQDMVRLPTVIETSIYRTCQEALNNVARHSNATRVDIFMAVVREQQNGNAVLRVEIKDNGTGFDPSSIRLNDQAMKGLGLLGMRERVTQCGGELEIHSSLGSGTILQISLPLDLPKENLAS